MRCLGHFWALILADSMVFSRVLQGIGNAQLCFLRGGGSAMQSHLVGRSLD